MTTNELIKKLQEVDPTGEGIIKTSIFEEAFDIREIVIKDNPNDTYEVWMNSYYSNSNIK